MTKELDPEVLELLKLLDITQLTHFTPARNLLNILLSGQILSTSELDSSALEHVITDADRWDGHREMVCCSIQLPNVYYFQKAQAKPSAINYDDWAVFFLEPTLAARTGTLFSPGNAALGRGVNLRSGSAGLSKLYDSQVGQFSRDPNHTLACPTDVQAEVLIPGSIDIDQVKGIYLPSPAHIRQERGRLKQLGGNPDLFAWFSCPHLFAVNTVVSAIRHGATLIAQPWEDPEIRGDHNEC